VHLEVLEVRIHIGILEGRSVVKHSQRIGNHCQQRNDTTTSAFLKITLVSVEGQDGKGWGQELKSAGMSQVTRVAWTRRKMDRFMEQVGLGAGGSCL
jgi:hypothetical protein